ncbi:hypothetical protein LBO01_19240 [Companilactobacillus paralimentarius]|nr:hypothetical protein LBO01_19240 [Companilactobacillus paralimentarius]
MLVVGTVAGSVALLLVKADPDTVVLASAVKVTGLLVVALVSVVGDTVEIVVDFGVTKVALAGFIPEVVEWATAT